MREILVMGLIPCGDTVRLSWVRVQTMPWIDENASQLLRTVYRRKIDYI